jgi:hypothetical protein
MKDIIFVQFYNQRKAYFTFTGFCNGFSDTWNFCKTKGDMVWVKTEEYDETKSQDFYYAEAPIKKGTMYVSCFFLSHLYQCYLWAKDLPQLKIIAGGPVIELVTYNKSDIPKNLQLITKSVEEFFGLENFSQQWNLEIDSVPIDLNNKISFSYTIDSFCYNGKCIFCDYNISKRRKRKIIDFNAFSKFQDYKKHLILYSPSLKPSSLDILFELPHGDKNTYFILLRPDKHLNKKFKQLGYIKDKLPILSVNIGIDFLGNRMLNYINKNHTVEDAIETLQFLNENNIKTVVTTLLRWPVLTNDDIKEVEKYIHHPIIKKQDWIINDLTTKVKSKLGKDPLYIGEEYKFGPFLIGFIPCLTNEQQQQNQIIRNLFSDNIKNLVDRQDKHIKHPYQF